MELERGLLRFKLFLSTPSVRRATCSQVSVCLRHSISIHALREEGDRRGSRWCRNRTISIHALREEGDGTDGRIGMYVEISTHTLREEGDDREGVWMTDWLQFLSTPSTRRATASPCGAGRQTPYFYPRPPRGGRQQKQRENTLLLSHYTPPCTNCKEVSVKQAVKLHRYLHSRLLFQCEASRKTMCTVCSHWPDIKRSARCPVQTPGVVQRVRPWSGSCCPVGRTADCLRRG